MRVLIIFYCCLLIANAANAEINLKEYNAYLNQLNNIEAEFIQVSADGKTQAGKFHLKKPGKMRWDYLSPQQFSIIINGNKLTHYDKQLDEATYGHSEELAVHFLAKENINLAQDMRVLSANKAVDGNTHIDLQLKHSKDYGKHIIKLIFKNKSLTLSGIVVINPDRQYTTLTFTNIIKQKYIADDLFYVADPRLARKTKIR